MVDREVVAIALGLGIIALASVVLVARAALPL